MNRQVPETIAIVGNGKVARHMMHYFASVSQPYVHWFRQHQSLRPKATPNSRLARYKQRLQQFFNPPHTNSLESAIEPATTVLLLIPDDQIRQFIQNNPALDNKTLVHFSGSLALDGVVSCHPLMTFGPDLYDESKYPTIPFVVDEGVVFNDLFPLLKNPVHSILDEHKVMYHAMCVMAGNFSQMLWRHVEAEVQRIGLPEGVMSKYLMQNTMNFIKDSKHSATGPFVRGDIETITKHQRALADHPLGDIYQAFFELYHQAEPQPNRKLL